MTDGTSLNMPSLALTQRLPVSATIICLNEESCIGACIESLDAASEIIIVDSGSTDRTLEIVADYARTYPIRLVHQDWLGFAAQKQLACDLASQPWVLSIDADESLDAELQAALPDLLKAPTDIVGWKLRRSRKFYGPETSLARFARPAKIFRLYRNGLARFGLEDLVHEGLRTTGRVQTCTRGLLRHEGAFPVEKQIVKETKYALLKARQRMQAGKKPSLLRLMLSPVYRFLRSLVMDRLILCGRQGWIEAQTAATYSFLTEAIHYQMWVESKSK
eukprot:gene2551-2590_t